MKVSIQNIIKILFLLLGFFWIFFSFYLLFRDREQTNIFFKVSFYIMFCFQILYFFRKSKNYFFIKLNDFILKMKLQYYKKPLDILFDNVFKPLPFIGDILMFSCKYVVIFYKKLGFYCIRISSVIFFIIPQATLLILIFLNIFCKMQLYSLIIITLLYSRFYYFFVFVLIDFSALNKAILEKYLIIKEVNSQLFIDMNKNTMKKQTQEELNLYAKRYILFKETHFYVLTTKLYYENNFKLYLDALFFALIFTGSFKFVFSSFITETFIYSLFFLFVLLKEYKNLHIKKMPKTIGSNLP